MIFSKSIKCNNIYFNFTRRVLPKYAYFLIAGLVTENQLFCTSKRILDFERINYYILKCKEYFTHSARHGLHMKYRMSVIFFLHFISVRHFFSPQKKNTYPPRWNKNFEKKSKTPFFSCDHELQNFCCHRAYVEANGWTNLLIIFFLQIIEKKCEHSSFEIRKVKKSYSFRTCAGVF